VVHLMNHHVLVPGETPQASLRVIRPGLILGAATTVAGLAGLAWTSFPGIRQMAVFTSVGVAVALVLTMLVLPPFLPAAPKATPLHKQLVTIAGGFFEGLARRRRVMAAFVLVCIAVAAIGVPQLDWEDDIRALSPMNAELIAEDERVRARVARMDAGRLLFVTGATMEEALVRNDELYQRLVDARAAGELEAFRSLHAFLPSVATQEARVAALPEDLFARTMQAFVAEGFVADAFAPFDESLRADFEPLTFDAFAATPLALLTSSHRIDTEDGVILLTFVRGVVDSAQIQSRIEGVEAAHYFDQREYMASAYREFRASTVELVGLGLLFVFLLVFIRYRALRPSLAAFLPASLAAATALGVFGLLGIPANLLHVVCLLLVLSMGVDYGVFMVEAGLAGSDHRHEAPTLVSLVVACASTFASFGVLALSANPALRAMGLTAAIGVFVSLVLAPSAWLLLRR
jgi:predicted exporter